MENSLGKLGGCGLLRLDTAGQYYGCLEHDIGWTTCIRHQDGEYGYVGPYIDELMDTIVDASQLE